MHYHIEDEYERDYSFEPEIILRRKDSLSIQREHYQHRKQLKRRKQFKQSQIVAIARLPGLRRLSNPAEGGGGGLMAQCPGAAEAGGSFQQPTTTATPTDQSQSDDLDSDDKAEIQRSPIEVELEEFYYVSPSVLMASPRGLSLMVFCLGFNCFFGFSFLFSSNSGETKIEIADPTVESQQWRKCTHSPTQHQRNWHRFRYFFESFYCLFIQSLPNSEILNHCVKVVGEYCVLFAHAGYTLTPFCSKSKNSTIMVQCLQIHQI